MEFQLVVYSTKEGKEPFREWLRNLKDLEIQSQILQRLQRIRLGNFGDCKPLQKGLYELRIHSGSGFRIYYARVGYQLILLLGGGGKKSQQRDIDRMMGYLEDHKKRNE